MSFTGCYREGVSFHTSDLLTSRLGICHAFTTRVGGVSQGVYEGLNLRLNGSDDPEHVRENFRRLASAVGFSLDNLILSDQCHSDNVLAVTHADAGSGFMRPRTFCEVDALITNERDLPILVYSADCNIALLYDSATHCIGACHAGWRGAANGIMGKTVREMQRVYGADPATIRVAIGAGIGPCCFETDDDVPDTMRASLGAEAEAYLVRDGEKWHVDLKGINVCHLVRAGVKAHHIDVDPTCTACHPELYWSHRKLGEVRGAQAAVISLI